MTSDRTGIVAAVVACATLAVAIIAGQFVIGYVVTGGMAIVWATGLAIGVAWIVTDLLVKRYPPLGPRLAIVGLGVAWLAWSGWSVYRRGMDDPAFFHMMAAAVLLIAPWQTFKGGDG